MTTDAKTPCYIHDEDVPWGDYSAYYPADMMQRMRAKRLMGPGGVMPQGDMLMGILELDPGASYPPHRHAAPEVYYVTQGQAECLFGGERFIAKPGTAIYTRPNQVHSFRNIGDERFFAVGFWWAPGGDQDTLRCKLELLDDQ